MQDEGWFHNLEIEIVLTRLDLISLSYKLFSSAYM